MQIATRVIKHSIPWLITAVALYFAFKGIDWDAFFNHLKQASGTWLLGAVLLTIASYAIRAYRWLWLFPKKVPTYLDAYKILILGFLMNNVLPARAGELVRAHFGAKISGEKRTLVLATVASERLADGLTISLMFVIFAISIGDAGLSKNFLYVAFAFGIATLGVITVLALREPIFKIISKLVGKFDSKASQYTLSRMQLFIEGLSPLCSLSRVPYITVLSAITWSVELGVFYFVSEAYGSPLTLSQCVLFLVAVNFSSLIPAAPGGIGVIEAITKAVLVSLGMDNEHALSLVITQHVIQYVCIGIPGAIILITLKQSLSDLQHEAESSLSDTDQTEPQPSV